MSAVLVLVGFGVRASYPPLVRSGIVATLRGCGLTPFDRTDSGRAIAVPLLTAAPNPSDVIVLRSRNCNRIETMSGYRTAVRWSVRGTVFG